MNLVHVKVKIQYQINQFRKLFTFQKFSTSTSVSVGARNLVRRAKEKAEPLRASGAQRLCFCSVAVHLTRPINILQPGPDRTRYTSCTSLAALSDYFNNILSGRKTLPKRSCRLGRVSFVPQDNFL